MSHEASGEVIDVCLDWGGFRGFKGWRAVSGSGEGGHSSVRGVGSMIGSVVWSVLRCEGLGEGCGLVGWGVGRERSAIQRRMWLVTSLQMEWNIWSIWSRRIVVRS